MHRVLLVFDPPDGGVSENVRRLALMLPEHGWQPFIAGPRDSLIYEEVGAAGVPIVRLPLMPGWDHLVSDMKALRKLVAILRREPFDLVHSHNAKAGVIARLAARIAGVPTVYSPHCFPFVAPFSRTRLLASATIERACGHATDLLLCVADEERQRGLEKRIVPESRMRVIHNGCLPFEDGLTPDAELERFRAGRPLAATLCVLREQKAVHTFVAAAPAVLERCPDAVLAVIGDGELRQDLQAQARSLGLGERFGFFPYLQPPSRQLASLDVLVLPSAWEAFPIAILEAMACGVPQVATDVGGTSEAVLDGETGLLCPANDPEALAERVSTVLLDANLRKRMSAESRRRYEAEFRLETMVEKTSALYGELVAA